MDGQSGIGGKPPLPIDQNASSEPDSTTENKGAMPQTSRGTRPPAIPITNRRLASAFQGAKLNLSLSPSGPLVMEAGIDRNDPKDVLGEKLRNYARSATLAADELPAQLAKLDFFAPEPAPQSEPALSHGRFKMHPIGNEKIKLHAHPIPANPNEAEAIWTLSEKADIKRIIALQESIQYPYVPSYGATEADYGSYHVEIKSRTPITELSDKAHSVSVEVTNKETSEKRTVTVDQLFFWGDDLGIDVSLVPELLKRVPSSHCQIHCQQGVGRTGTLIMLKVMQEASEDGELTRDNLVKFIATTTRKFTKQRGNEFVKTPQQFRLLMEYGMQLTGATMDDINKQLSN